MGIKMGLGSRGARPPLATGRGGRRNGGGGIARTDAYGTETGRCRKWAAQGLTREAGRDAGSGCWSGYCAGLEPRG